MKKAFGLLLGLWITFSVLLFHWIGLLGEAFSYSATDLVYLKLGVVLWIGHGLYTSAIVLMPGSWPLAESRLLSTCVMLSALIFDLILLIGGRPITVVLALVPIAHALIILWLWRVQRLAR